MTEDRTRGRAIAALVTTQLLFGLWPVVGTMVLARVPAAALVGVRIGVSGPLLFLLARPWRARLSGREILACAGLSLLGVVLNQALFIEGLARSTPINSAVLGTLIPVYTVLFAVLLKQEKASRTRLLGLAVAMAGALFLIGADRLELGRERMHGNLLLVANCAVYSAYLVLARPLLGRHGALPVIGWVFLFSVPGILPYALPSLRAVDWLALPWPIWAGLAYIVIAASILPYALNAFALKHLPASSVASFVYFQPLVTALASAVLLHQLPGWQVLLSSTLVFAGVALVTRNRTA